MRITSREIICVLLSALLAWQALVVIASGMSRNLMFDGAMNLEISKSIAEGNGPRRIYDSGDLFPPGVQSKEPFVLLGAAVFKVFGVGNWQAQLPNIIYFLLATAMIIILVKRATDTPTALMAAILATGTPAFTQYALNGYGEIPTLFFGLCSLAVVIWPERFSTSLIWRSLLAGALAGLALATKVVGVVQIAAIGLVLCLRVFAEAAGTFQRLRAIAISVLAFSLAALIPLLLVEWWRWSWLGQDGYIGWWEIQFGSIKSHAGAAPTGAELNYLDKATHHLGLLANELRRTRAATVALIILPLAAVGISFSQLPPPQRMQRRWLLLALLAIVALYFPWWLGVVPTEKAWLRYLYIGLIALDIVAAIAFVSNIQEAFRAKDSWRRFLHGALAASVIFLYLPFIAKSAVTRLNFQPGEELQATQYAAKVISRLEPNKTAFGYGWYAAPTIQLYADRGFQDFTDWPIGRLTTQPAYLVADRATVMTNMLERVLARYPHKKLMRDNPYAQVYEVDFARPNDPFQGMDAAAIQATVNFSETAYPLTSGMEPYDPMGGRFVESDSEVLLKYQGQDTLVLTGYMAPPGFYRLPEALSGRVLVDGCPAMSFAFKQNGWETFRLPLSCTPALDSNVRVRLLLNNVFDLPLLFDRQRALLLQSIGFI
jgi:hypothetical protein